MEMERDERQMSEDNRLGVTQKALRKRGQEHLAGWAESANEVQTKQVETTADTCEPAQVETQPKQLKAALMDESEQKDDTVQIRIEPFVPVVVGGADAEQSIFGGQVFMLRHVQIEDRHFLQGFQLDERRLLEEIKDSAKRFMREGMDFELSQVQNTDAAFAAILDFGFGDLVLNLIEIDPAWIGRQIDKLQNWYFSIIGIVLLAVSLGLASLWRNARAQFKLTQKKDDFISAVSHELRTPLTSIRMYAEMLEKNWVKSEVKVIEYYRNMRQESERLSRLIENVLNFSRIQKGKKKYTFSLGDMNRCITEVVEMMGPYATQRGFSIKTDFEELGQIAFDSDAVTQIVVNLLDNAVKYARQAKDKTITIRTRNQDQFILIEVEDHGPGVPHRQRKKVFEEFYRTGSEATRETNGTGLGLALVKKFAEAHNGFVEILTAKPMGAIFRVGLALKS
jgi:two-component system phosphate regulon sensor histidine kinase PhoR